jgi:hypothetical protein
MIHVSTMDEKSKLASCLGHARSRRSGTAENVSRDRENFAPSLPRKPVVVRVLCDGAPRRGHPTSLPASSSNDIVLRILSTAVDLVDRCVPLHVTRKISTPNKRTLRG